jgi:hypothetical protein
VRIVNQVRNASPIVRRKDAQYLVNFGRAEWVGSDQVRLIPLHPANRAEMVEAACAYDCASKVLVRSVNELRHIPMTGDPMKALMLRTKRTRPAGESH